MPQQLLNKVPGPKLTEPHKCSTAEWLSSRITSSPSLIANPVRAEIEGQLFELPRYVFIGPKGGDDPFRLAIFAGLHGDEPEGVHALVRFLSEKEKCQSMIM